MLALVLGEGVFWGVLAGVGSNPAAAAADARLVFLAPKPSTAAAVAVLSTVKDPDARRVESMAGIRFFGGDVDGVMLRELLAER